MKSRTTGRFRRAFAGLTIELQRQTREAYRRFLVDPQHPGLQFKKVHRTLPIYSARVNIDCRVVGVLSGDEVVWFWVGSHAEYEKLLKSL